MPLYSDVHGRKVVFWLSQIGFGAGPLILSWISEICSSDAEQRALLVAAGNDFVHVVQAVAPNFVWKTTDFPTARKGYTWSLFSRLYSVSLSVKLLIRDVVLTTFASAVLWTALVQLLL